MNIDSHQHFWKYDPIEFEWTGGPDSPISRDFGPEQLKPLLAAHGFEGTVAVQARSSLEENEDLLELADRHEWIRAVVGWVDLRAPDVREQLARYAGHPKFKGVRHIVQAEPDDRFLLRDDFCRGVKALSEFGLTYDILIYHRHLPAAIEFVRRFPDQPFVVDHIAKPDIKGGALEPWAERIRELARFENVWCKVSGMVTEADWRGWKESDFEPYVNTVFEAFGPKRLMFGSDWPVCLLAADYGRTVELVERFVREWSKEERALLFGGNCAAFYGIGG
ncbi:amidohydrolase family protein [Paenibacillus sp.]|uniref:amidohydrolase family protein n=1 Tax=Paenibacillus sp. TaxID=58172 RepID=UPI002D642E1F|nr:amidohydrolase family protein [Paenibacillus sp.]HZG85046.1 amidohydrolase family protein [Paenibacillus sp.]